MNPKKSLTRIAPTKMCEDIKETSCPARVISYSWPGCMPNWSNFSRRVSREMPSQRAARA